MSKNRLKRRIGELNSNVYRLQLYTAYVEELKQWIVEGAVLSSDTNSFDLAAFSDLTTASANISGDSEVCK